MDQSEWNRLKWTEKDQSRPNWIKILKKNGDVIDDMDQQECNYIKCYTSTLLHKKKVYLFFSLSLSSIIHFCLCSSITQIPQRCSWNFGKLSWRRKSETCELKSVKSFQVSNGKKVTSDLIGDHILNTSVQDQITYLPQHYGVRINMYMI